MGGRSFSVIGAERLIFAIVGWNSSQMQNLFLIVHYINLVSDLGYYRREAERTMKELKRERIEDLESKR
jgi:hypothetical protein